MSRNKHINNRVHQSGKIVPYTPPKKYENSWKSYEKIVCNQFNSSEKEPEISFREQPYTPIILITPIAYSKMLHYVDIASGEVGWLGIVEEDNKDFIITDVFLFEQNVSGTHTSITEEGLSKFTEQILKLENGMEIINKMKFWGHSHVNFDTFASAQDDSQMEIFSNCGHDNFIRGIFNKKGSVHFTHYDYKNCFSVDHCKWNIFCPRDESLREGIEREFKDKVTSGYGGGGYGGYGGGYTPYKSYQDVDDDGDNNHGVRNFIRCGVCNKSLMRTYKEDVICAKCYNVMTPHQKRINVLANEDKHLIDKDDDDNDLQKHLDSHSLGDFDSDEVVII